MTAPTRDPSKVGLFGKIPSQGDFVTQDLPRDFVETWDHWLQQAMLASQEALQSAWLEYFLISPVWRFVLPSGCIKASTWAGIVLPSVDRVGRYYPLTLAAPLTGSIGVFEFASRADDWFAALEEVAFATLEQGLNVDELALRLAQLPVAPSSDSEVLPLVAQRHRQHSVVLATPEQTVASLTPRLCDALLKPQSSAFSLWQTRGSEHVPAVLLLADKLPRPTSFTAMLNGQWQNWHWPTLIQISPC